jgi:phosphoenolpyruvate-protein kinase (PTS system EI component)
MEAEIAKAEAEEAKAEAERVKKEEADAAKFVKEQAGKLGDIEARLKENIAKVEAVEKAFNE